MDGWDSKDLVAGSAGEMEKRVEHMHGILFPKKSDVQHLVRTDA
jgi:hypothetical protein